MRSMMVLTKVVYPLLCVQGSLQYSDNTEHNTQLRRLSGALHQSQLSSGHTADQSQAGITVILSTHIPHLDPFSDEELSTSF